MAMAMASRPDDGDATKRYPWYHNVTLEDVLPRRGFLFAEDHKIFDTVQDGLVAKWALHVATPWFEEYKIDEALAAVMNEFLRLLTIVRNPSGSCYLTEDQIDEIFEHAGQSFSWAEHLPKGFLSRLMGKMIRGRFVYVRLTEMRGMPESDVGKKTGQLAAAIDVWRREKPFEKPDESWTRMPAMFVDYAMERFIQGKGADWDRVWDYSELGITNDQVNDGGEGSASNHGVQSADNHDAQQVDSQITMVDAELEESSNASADAIVTRGRDKEAEVMVKIEGGFGSSHKVTGSVSMDSESADAASDGVKVIVMHLHCGSCGSHDLRVCTTQH